VRECFTIRSPARTQLGTPRSRSSYSKEQPAHPEVVLPCDGIYDEDQDEVRYYTRDELETLRGGGSVHGG